MIEITRHRELFNPDDDGARQPCIVGAGAMGSWIAYQLACLGVKDMQVYDYDIVESHNLANQVYSVSDVGKSKVSALAENLERKVGYSVLYPHEKRIEKGDTIQGGFSFLAVDSIEGRSDIVENVLPRSTMQRCIDVRMGATRGEIYAFNPLSPAQREWWKSTLPDDDTPIEASACGTSLTVGSTAQALSGVAVWQYVMFHKTTILPNYIYFDFRDGAVQTETVNFI